jgi:hypothetical protein
MLTHPLGNVGADPAAEPLVAAGAGTVKPGIAGTTSAP